MNQALPLIVLGALVLGLLLVARRARHRAAAQDRHRRETITFGTDVMTTSGLYGTVTRIDDDETVRLAIAPGVEVRWALAALRDVSSLPPQYRRDAPEIGADPSEIRADPSEIRAEPSARTPSAPSVDEGSAPGERPPR